MSDPYASSAVHGTLPICRDVDTGRLRFARPGVDLPEDCLTSPDQLPDAELALVVMPTPETIDAWAAGAREFSGNSVDIITPELDRKIIPCALVVRHDRPRRAGATLDEVIELRRGLEGKGEDRIDFTRQRMDLQARTTAANNRSAWKAGWTVELTFASATGLKLGPESYDHERKPGDPLQLELPVPVLIGAFGLLVTFERTESGLLASKNEITPMLDEDLALIRTKRMAELGVSKVGNNLQMMGSALTTEFVQQIQHAMSELKTTTNHLEMTQRSRADVREAIADDRGMAMLKRIAGGGLVVTYHLAQPGCQINPSTGNPTVVPATHIGNAHSRGLIRIIHPGDDARAVPERGATRLRIPVILSLTETGKAVLDGRLQDAATSIRIDREHNNAVRNTRDRDLVRPELGHALRTAIAALNPDKSLAGKLSDQLDGTFVTLALRGNVSDRGWAILAPAIGLDVLPFENDQVRTAAPAPGGMT